MPTAKLLLAATYLISIFSTVQASPKVVSLDFQKRAVPRNAVPLRAHRKRANTVTATLHNEEYLYLINVTAGTPPQSFSLHLDTGSSDIWLPYADLQVCRSTDRCSQGVYDDARSNTIVDLTDTQGFPAFDISYVDGTHIMGVYITDHINVGGTDIQNMTMGIATDVELTDDFSPLQGIMGVGYQSGESIASQSPDYIYPNIISQLKNQGKINTRAYSLWLNDLESATGSILFGGVDTEKYEGDLVALPVQQDTSSGSLSSFTVVFDNMAFLSPSGQASYSQSNLRIPVILDSGTTLTYLPDNIANDIAGGVGAFPDSEAGMVVPCSVGTSASTISFGFGSASGPKIRVELSQFVLPFPPQPNGRPVAFRDGTPACQWGILGSGEDPNLFGDTFLRSAYVVYDIDNDVVAIAQTTFNSTNSDVQEIRDQIPGATSTASGAVVTQTFSGYPHQSMGSGPRNTIVTALPTPTFDLGAAGASGGSGAGGAQRTGAAVAVSVPAVFEKGLWAVGMVVLSMLGGTMLIWP